MLDQPLRSFVDMANRNECFSDFSKHKTAKERWDSSVSRMGDRKEYLERPLPLPLPPSLYGRSLTRSYADVITKFSRLDGSPLFLTHGASLALKIELMEEFSEAKICKIKPELRNSNVNADYF